MAGFTTVTTSHSGVATLCDYMFYVDPDVRSIETLGGLVKASQEFAKEQGMRMRIEFISRNDEKLRKRMFERFGFDVVAVVGGYNG